MLYNQIEIHILQLNYQMIKEEIATVPVTDGNIYREHFLKYAFCKSKQTSAPGNFATRFLQFYLPTYRSFKLV